VSGAGRIYAVSEAATPAPTATRTGPSVAPTAASVPPSPTPTLAPVVYTLDFGVERRDDLRMRVGQALQLKLTTGPTSDWLSGVDDARVLRPVSPTGSGIYQAVAPGTALLTAHVLQGCADVAPKVRCRNPEHGLWFQTRVYVMP
jgi:hypothetical protein